MKAMREASSPADRTRLSRKCEDMLGLAERLKSLSMNPDPPGPRSNRQLSTAEKAILLRSSKLHGLVFPPWDIAPELKSFAKVGGEMFMYASPEKVLTLIFCG